MSSTVITPGLDRAELMAAALPAGRFGDFLLPADVPGVHVASADHSGATRSTAMGYGAHGDLARIGAYGELLESVLPHQELREAAPERAGYRALVAVYGADAVVDPRTLVLTAGTAVDLDAPRDWLPMRRWRTGAAVLVPAEFCANAADDLPWQPAQERLITVITNGAGAGECAERAVAHALLELVQRDGNVTAFRAMDAGVVLELDEVADPVTRNILQSMDSRGIEVLPKLASTQFGMACVHVVGADRDARGPHAPSEPIALTACGEACHPDREVALRKAVLEFAAARQRKAFFHGPLDRVGPLAPAGYWQREFESPVPAQEPRARYAMARWMQLPAQALRALLEPVVLARRSSVAFSALPTASPGSLGRPADLLAHLLEVLAGFDVLVRLTEGDGGVAAKVLVPGLEAETMSYARIGARGVRKLLERGSPLAGLGPPSRPGTAPVVLTEAGRDALGGDAWLDLDLLHRTAAPLYPLYREPSRHALARLAVRR